MKDPLNKSEEVIENPFESKILRQNTTLFKSDKLASPTVRNAEDLITNNLSEPQNNENSVLLRLYSLTDTQESINGPPISVDSIFSGRTMMDGVHQLPQLKVEPIEATVGLRRMASNAIKRAITEMDIYGHPGEIRLDERQLSRDLEVSRTPIREALSLLEQEGFVRSVPRRGIYIVRKNKREIIEMITVWAAIESMAARLACERASDAEIAKLREIAEFKKNPSAFVDEYSQSNMIFHKTIIQLSGCALMSEMIENLFIHMRAIRSATMKQGDRPQRSLIDHMNILAAIENRDADLAAKRVREHTLGLAMHIEKHGDFLDLFQSAGNGKRTSYG